MAISLPTRDDWRRTLVTTRTSSGQILILYSVEKRTCDACPHGIETVTVWITPTGKAERIVWCSSCFNARCEPVDGRQLERRRCAQLRQRVLAAPVLRSWSAARPAVEDLERRGLL